MTGLIILLILALLIFLFLRARIGVKAWVTPDAHEVRLRFGIFSFRVLPSKPKRKPKRVKRPKKEKAKPPAVRKKPTLTAGSVTALLPAVRRALSRIIRGFRIERFYFHMVAASDDAAKTALLYGAVHAGLGLMAPLTARIRDADITVGLDYSLPKPVVYTSFALSVRTGAVLAAALSLLMAFWRNREHVVT